jgi:hypothetical protein
MTVSVRRHLESETVHIPELAAMIGKDVQIIVVERSQESAGSPDLSALDKIAGKIDLDFQAIEDLRAGSLV